MKFEMSTSAHHFRTTHIDIRYHYVREVFESCEIDVHYNPTQNMTADIFAKTISMAAYRRHLEKMGVGVPR